jgi:predicted transcriptional regulator
MGRKIFLFGIFSSMSRLGSVLAVDMPITVGSQSLTLRLPDESWSAATVDRAVSEMTERFQQVLAAELQDKGKLSLPQRQQQDQDENLVIQLNVDGEPHSMSIPRGADIKAGIAQFAAQKGLDPAAQQALTEQATKIATSKGFMPVLLHPFKFQADGPVHRLPVYAGQSVEVAVGSFLSSLGAPAATQQQIVPKLVADVKVELVSRGLAPLSKFTLKNPRDNHQFPVSLFVGENLTDSVLKQCAANGMAEEDALLARNQVMADMREKGLLPMGEFPVQVDGTAQVLSVFAGETVNQAVDRFVKTHRINEDVVPELRTLVHNRLVEEGLSPMAAVAVQLAQGHKVELPLYKGVPVQESISQFIQKHRVSPEEAPRLRMSVQKSLQDKGLAPLMELAFDVSGKKAVLPLFTGQNVTEQVLKFGQAQNIGPQGLEQIFSEVNRNLRDKGLAPLAEFNIEWNGKRLSIAFHQGENLGLVVKAFVAQHGLPESSIPGLMEQLTVELVQSGHVPMAQLPVKIGQSQLMLQVFKGETSEQAVSKFIAAHKLNQSLLPNLKQGLETRMKEAGITPMSEYTIMFNNQELVLQLFVGEKVEDAVSKFVAKYGLPQTSVEGIIAELSRRAMANGEIPFVRIPMTVRGEEHELPLYLGQDIAKEVATFGRANGVSEHEMPNLQKAVQQYLDQERAKSVQGTAQP